MEVHLFILFNNKRQTTLTWILSVDFKAVYILVLFVDTSLFNPDMLLQGDRAGHRQIKQATWCTHE